MPSKRPTAGQAESKASSQSSAEVRRLWEEPTEGTDHAVVPVGIPRVQAGEDVNPQQAGVSAGLRDLVVDLHKHSNDHIHSESEIERAQAAVEGVIADRLSALLATAPPEQAAPDGNIWSEVRRLQEIRLRAAVTQEPAVAFSADDMKFVLSLIDQRDRAFKELIRAKPDQPQAASAGALSGGPAREVIEPFDAGGPLSKEDLLTLDDLQKTHPNLWRHFRECGQAVLELQQQLAAHDQKVRDDALEEAALAVTGVHTSYHHNDSTETIGTFVRRHSAAIQEVIRSRKDAQDER